jgi:transitional endoplasmic reticulum ATPase
MVEEITLKVVEAKQRDVGRKIARIDSEIMKKLDLVPNDIVEIIGKKSTTAIVWPAYREDEKAGIIRIDGETRRNAGVAVEDVVQIRKAKAKPAEKVVLAPFEQLPFIGDIGRIVLVQLMNRPVSKGDVLVVPILGVGLELKVNIHRNK